MERVAGKGELSETLRSVCVKGHWHGCRPGNNGCLQNACKWEEPNGCLAWLSGAAECCSSLVLRHALSYLQVKERENKIHPHARKVSIDAIKCGRIVFNKSTKPGAGRAQSVRAPKMIPPHLALPP